MVSKLTTRLPIHWQMMNSTYSMLSMKMHLHLMLPTCIAFHLSTDVGKIYLSIHHRMIADIRADMYLVVIEHINLMIGRPAAPYHSICITLVCPQMIARDELTVGIAH
jgi:hypothetical protein